MAIKDIFKMIKADRYTQDGREELIKAQEAVTEDVTYKPGDISRKTGLQKQPDGSWAPVNNAPAQKKGLGGKTLTKGAKHYPTVGEYAENAPIEQRMAMQKLLEKNGPVEKTKQSASGDPQNVYGAKVDEIYERQLKRIKELKAKGYTDEQIDSDKIIKQTKEDMKNVGKKSTSGSGLSERAQYSVSQTAAGMSTEALKSHVDKLKNDPATRKAISNPDAMAKVYESELAKRGETVTKMSDLVAQKSRPESAPSGRQPTPEMLEREKMRKSPEAKARRDKLDAEHPRTETGAPMTPKLGLKKGDTAYTKYGERAEILEVDGDKVLTKLNGHTEWHSERAFEGKVNKPTENKPTGPAPSELKIQGMSKEEYIPWRMKTYKENEAQASSVWNHFAEQQKNKGKENEYDPDFHPLRDSAPRILTGDCKVRIKKSK